MKKLRFAALAMLLLLSGCEKRQTQIAPESLFVLEDGVTSQGIQAGDTPEEFQEAYGDYIIQVAYENTGYTPMSINRIPYNEPISTMIANFFINGEPVSDEEICRENEIEPEDLYSLLSSYEYLTSHEVIYRYLEFSWESGVIADINAGELYYNETFETPYRG